MTTGWGSVLAAEDEPQHDSRHDEHDGEGDERDSSVVARRLSTRVDAAPRARAQNQQHSEGRDEAGEDGPRSVHSTLLSASASLRALRSDRLNPNRCRTSSTNAPATAMRARPSGLPGSYSRTATTVAGSAVAPPPPPPAGGVTSSVTAPKRSPSCSRKRVSSVDAAPVDPAEASRSPSVRAVSK